VLDSQEELVSNKQNLYTGRSGQMAVMAEFLRRGYNVAVPEVDVGEDVLVIRDRDGRLSRVQVKAAIGKGTKGASGTFKVSLAQLEREHRPELHYVLALHQGGLWREFLVIPRQSLETLWRVNGVGNELDGHLVLRVAFTGQDARCRGTSLQAHRGDWSEWPEIKH
jgi:hypothetical protein